MPTYALDKLLELRRTAEDDAGRTLAEATVAAVQAKTASQALKRAASAARRVWEQARADVVPLQPAGEALATHRFVARLGAAWESKWQQTNRHREAVLEPAVRAAESARQAYLTARQEREAVERHVDRQRAAVRVAAERRSDDS